MKDTRYDEGDVVKVDGDAEELDTGARGFAKMYGKIVDIEKPQSNSPDYEVQAYMNGTPVRGWFKAAALDKVEDWELETEVLLENRMEVGVNQGSYSYYEDLGATFYEAKGTGVNNESEWIVFRNYEQAKKAAIMKVKRDLKEEPEIFNDSFMRKHTYITETDKRMIAQEEARHIYEDIPNEEIIEEAKSYGLRAENADVAREQLEQKRAEEIQEKLDNPFEYFVEERGLYTQEELGRQDFTRMDIQEAAEDAVETDGVGHFLDVYDGRAVELENGALAYATN